MVSSGTGELDLILVGAVAVADMAGIRVLKVEELVDPGELWRTGDLGCNEALMSP